MDFNSLKDQVSNLTLYDIKAGVRKVQNAVMNYTEMEAKVREATNNEPWGASSTLMQEIANGTFNYQTLNEIMPMIYRRFTEKSAEEWRQIYKSLQLLEFLVKNGSERVIDDARSHLTLLKMLRQFHFIDQNGKDQGLNVRNRAKELAELLGDVERIRAERKRARANKAKYVGAGSSASRYGGFGSESAGLGGGGGSGSTTYGGYSGGVYGDGGGFGGQGSEYNEGSGRNGKFEEYDEFDEAERPAATTSRAKTERVGAKKTTEAKRKEPEVDLFSFDEPGPELSPPIAAPTISLASLADANDDDEFDDFQSAPATQLARSAPALPAPSAQMMQFAAPKPVSAPQQAKVSNMVGNMIGLSSVSAAYPTSPSAGFSVSTVTMSAAMPMSPQPKSAGFQPPTPNYFSSVPASALPGGPSDGPASPKPTGVASKPAADGDAFGALWSQASGGMIKSTAGSGPAIGQLAKEKSRAGIWGASTATFTQTGPPPSTGNGTDDLLG